MAKNTERNLKKLGIPASAAAGCAVLVSMICNMLHA